MKYSKQKYLISKERQSAEIKEARAVRYTSEQIQKSVNEWLKNKRNKIVQCGCYWENEQ